MIKVVRYKCKCGAEFDTQKACSEHESQCRAVKMLQVSLAHETFKSGWRVSVLAYMGNPEYKVKKASFGHYIGYFPANETKNKAIRRTKLAAIEDINKELKDLANTSELKK